MSLRASFCDSLTFVDYNNLVHRGRADLFHRAARPANLHIIHGRGVSQTKMNSRVIRGGETASADYIRSLPDLPGAEIHGCTHSISRALRAADKFQFHPVVMIRIHVSQKCG